MATTFRDFIPAGEDPGALGAGYKDFVPEPKPVLRPVEEVLPEQPVDIKKKGGK